MTDSRAARVSRRRLLTMGAGITGALLVGCGDTERNGATSASPTGSAGPRTGTALPLRQRERLPSPTPDELRLGGIPDGTSTLLPAEQLLLYSRLVGFDPRQPAVYADLAREIEFVERLLIRFRLHRDARFHPDMSGNAAPVDAAAVERDFERRAAEHGYLFSEVVDQIETPADDTVLMRLRAPFALVFDLLARADASVRGERGYPGLDVPRGSGPFVLTHTGPAGRAFQRNPAWHSGTPGLAGLSMRFGVGDGELDAAFVRDELDVRVHPDAESRDAAGRREDAVRMHRASRRQRGLGLSLLGRKDGRTVRWVEAFQDERVRRAVSLGLDRGALLELDNSALCGPVGPAHGGDALSSTELQSHALLQHDPAEAHALLDAAGATGLEFRVQHLDSDGMLPLVRLVVQQLDDAGFEPRAMAMPGAEWETAFLRGDFEACVFELEALETPDLGLRLHTSEGLNGLFSLWGYSNPVYDAAVREALSEIDPAARALRSQAAQRLLLDDVPAMFPLAAPREHASLSPRVRGFEFGAYDFNTAYLSANWTVDETIPVDDSL